MDYTSFLAHTPHVTSFFDAATNTISYVVADPTTRKCAIIDSVLDYEPHSATVSYESTKKIIEHVEKHGFIVEWILETHVHADHLSAAKHLQEKLGGTIAMSNAITQVQKVFGEVFAEDARFQRDGSQFDVLFGADETFTIGTIPTAALHVPGHTPADVAYVVGNSIFTGDTIFMPDYGSARCDFPGGSAEALHASVQKLYTLPDSMKMYLCHDYLPEGRTEYQWETTVGDQKSSNVHLAESMDTNTFTTLRTTRDKQLGMPKLIIPALQVNMRAGELPRNEAGEIFFKIPVNAFSKNVD